MTTIELHAKKHEHFAATHALDAKILRMRMKGMDIPDIAKELGVSESRVQIPIYYAETPLSERMKKEEN